MLETFQAYISSFKQERLIRVYLPKNYSTEKKSYPVLYMHDGQNVFQDLEAIGGKSLDLENYLDAHELDLIVVAVDQNLQARIDEYCPWVSGEYSKSILGKESAEGGKGMHYVDFIVSELKPLIDSKYRTVRDQTAMAGISLGGLISIYAMCRYPHIFKQIAVLSSAFYRNQEEIMKLIEQTDLSLVKSVYLDCGSKEAGTDTKVNETFLASNQMVYELLKEKIPNTQFEIIDDAEHNYSYFKERVPHVFGFFILNDFHEK
ncbi:alpha/beta hydrolase-fold protein [Planococcus sp. 11815]|uniref:alpha/beta hydrolase n=1 Tax=Planococcus sp. 11815 TaxID=2939413 RepID=UPI003DA3AB81